MAGNKGPVKKVPAKKAPAKVAANATRPPRGAARSDADRLNPWQRYRARRATRKAAKKRRLAKLSRGQRIARRAGILAAWLLGGFVLLLIITLVLFYTFSRVPAPSALPLPQVATIEYSDGSVMARIGAEDRTVVPLSQVPVPVRYDVLSAEDRGFYSEPGFSIKGTARAALSDVFGGDTQGGSGITQQYVKNAYLSSQRSLTRKLKELMISVKLAHQYSKDTILGYYLNTVYFGRGTYGIEAASQAFFGEDVSKLNVAQGAVLAALLRDPGYYDPYNNPSAAKERWKFVLDGMVKTKHLTQQQEDALTYPKVRPPSQNQFGVSGPKALIVQRVIAELGAHGISESEINTRGLVIRTTIDRQAQADAESAIRQTFANLTAKQKNMKNALVALNPATGGVLAYYGGPNGRGYNGQDDYFDYAGVGTRPPGSSFKPYTLATVLTQTLKKTPGKPQLTISSYVNGSYCVTIQGRQICNDPGDEDVSSSSVKIADAMKYSLNTTFDQLAVEAGPNNVAATAHALGIPKKDPNGKPTLVDANGQTGFGIGIGDYPVSPLEQAVGYSTFANNGVSNAAYFVQKVTDSHGSVLYQHKAAPKHVLDPKVANDVTLTLEPIAAWSHDPLDGGRVSAAKTGTEGIYQDSSGNDSDAWMVGYTPQVTADVWVGSGNSTTPIYNSWGAPEYGSDLPGKTWALFMNMYLQNKPMLPMATTQEILGGENLAPAPTPTVSKTPTPSPSKTTPTPSKKPTTSKSAPSAPTSSAPAPSPPVPSPTPSPTPTLPVAGSSGDGAASGAPKSP